MSTVQIRAAVPGDIPRLAELLGVLFTQEVDFTPEPPRQERGLSMILSSPDIGRIWCAVDADQIVGMVSTLFTVSTAEGGRVAWLEDMIVDPQWRGKGIGGLLLAHALGEAKAAGCLRVTLLTDRNNEAAMRFYRQAGFMPSKMTPLRLKPL